MANNYCQSSTFVTIPKDKLGEAKSIVDKIETELEGGDEGYVGFVAELKENGVWIYDDESINPDHVEILIKALVEQLDLPGRHLCSWAYICSKPRIGEFGGGAFVVQKGKDTVWVDAERSKVTGERSESSTVGAMVDGLVISRPTNGEMDMTEFRKELETTINCHSRENGSDTPDFILAEYLTDCLKAFDAATKKREQWYGRGDEEVVCAKEI